MRADILDLLQEERERPLVYQYSRIVQERYFKLDKFIKDTNIPNPRILAMTMHIASQEPFRSLIVDTAESVKIADISFDEHEADVLRITASWKESADQLLLSLCPKTQSRKGKGKALSTSALALAATFFKCHWCSDPITYPRILMHTCLRVRKVVAEDEQNQDNANEDEDVEEDEENGAREVNRSASPRAPRPPKTINMQSAWEKMFHATVREWNAGGDQVQFDEEASSIARNIILACGEDPDTITHIEMERKDARVQCMRCYKPGKKRLVMPWKIAVCFDYLHACIHLTT